MASRGVYLQVGGWIMKPAAGMSGAGLQLAVDCDAKGLRALRSMCGRGVGWQREGT